MHVTWTGEPERCAVTLDDPASIAALERLLPPDLGAVVRRHRAAVRRAGRRSRVALGCLGAGLLLPVVACVALLIHPDPLIDVVVPRLPASLDRTIGAAVEAEVTARDDYAEVVVEEAVRRIGERLLATAPASPFDFRFHVIADDTVNAFAAPGGVVVVHTGLLRVVESPEELAGVLAHEIAHVLERHSLRQLAYRVGLLGTLGAALGFGDGLAGALADAASGLSNLAYGRSQELDADALGLELLQAAGIPPDGMIAFFERLQDASGTPALLATHPPSELRAERLRAALGTSSATATPPLDVDWAAVRRALGR